MPPALSNRISKHQNWKAPVPQIRPLTKHKNKPRKTKPSRELTQKYELLIFLKQRQSLKLKEFCHKKAVEI
jgi:hypothetical protein